MRDVKLLALEANPPDSGRIPITEEFRQIEKEKKGTKYGDWLQITYKFAVRTTELTGILRDEKPVIVHFSGHGSESGLTLVNDKGLKETVRVEAIRDLFGKFNDTVKLVILNACFSLPTAEALAEVIDCAIGSKRELGSTEARIFASQFYGNLCAGCSVREAFELCKVTLNMKESEAPELVARSGRDPSKMFLKDMTSSPGELSPSSFIKNEVPPDVLTTKKDLAASLSRFIGRKWAYEAVDAWLANPGARRVLWITGDPGTGKTALASWLCCNREAIRAFHFCDFDNVSSFNPRLFVLSIISQLGSSLPAYDEQLAAMDDFKQRVANSDATSLFKSLLREPLAYLQAPEKPIAILIDGLDEANKGDTNELVDLILPEFYKTPRWLKLIITSRCEPSLRQHIEHSDTCTLSRITPENKKDIRRYLRRELKPYTRDDANLLKRTTNTVLTRSDGVFLYVSCIRQNLENKHLSVDNLDEFPYGLGGIYKQYFKRHFQSADAKDSYKARIRPGLEAIAASQKPLQMELLQSVAGFAADNYWPKEFQSALGSLFPVTEYGIKPFHRSLIEWLTDKYEDGAGSCRVSEENGHALLAKYLRDRYGANWGKCVDEYALRYAPIHYANVAETSKDEPELWTRALIELTQNSEYQRRFETRIGDLPAREEHLHRALQVAARSDRDDMLPWLIKAALGYVAFQHEHLRPESVVQLADEGKLDQAEARLLLFPGIEKDWYTAARVIIAWLGSKENPVAAQQLYGHVKKAGELAKPLPLLMDRLEAALTHQFPDYQPYSNQPSYQPSFVPPLGQPSIDAAQALVKRFKGQDFNQELLDMSGLSGLGNGTPNPSLMIGVEPPDSQETLVDQSRYAAASDAPILVYVAREFGNEGTALLDQYIDAHTAYKYVEYRRGSLQYVLKAVLQYHPNQDWVKDRLRRILVAALTVGGIEFREMLPLTVLSLRERAGITDMRPNLSKWRLLALSAAQELGPQGIGDRWGRRARMLTGLMEIYHLVLGDVGEARELLSSIFAVPRGFAGYQAPAYLRLADALLACNIQQPGSPNGVIEDALRSAHQIQNSDFCARVTARCNALKRWHTQLLAGKDLAGTISRFITSPNDDEFATDHLIHEPYRYRDRTDLSLRSIADAEQADTLDQLAGIFQRPVVDFQRLNPQYGPTQRLEHLTPVKVPDPGFVPLLAIHFAARVVADESLDDEREALLRALVPIAASNPTALDTVLSYLLIVNQPDSEELLEQITSEAGSVDFADESPLTAKIEPYRTMPY